MIIRTEKVSKHFGGLKAVDEVDFVVKEGRLTSIIGPNGAGKTTLFNLIAGVHQPTGGKVIFKEKRHYQSLIASGISVGDHENLSDQSYFPQFDGL